MQLQRKDSPTWNFSRRGTHFDRNKWRHQQGTSRRRWSKPQLSSALDRSPKNRENAKDHRSACANRATTDVVAVALVIKLSVTESRFLDLFLLPSEGGLSTHTIIGFPINSMLLQWDHKISSCSSGFVFVPATTSGVAACCGRVIRIHMVWMYVSLTAIVVRVSELNPFANSSVPPLEFQNIEHLLSVPACRYICKVHLELNGQRCLSNVKQDTYINSLVFPWQQKDWINIFCTLVPTRSVHIMNWCPAHTVRSTCCRQIANRRFRNGGPVDGQQPTPFHSMGHVPMNYESLKRYGPSFLFSYPILLPVALFGNITAE